MLGGFALIGGYKLRLDDIVAARMIYRFPNDPASGASSIEVSIRGYGIAVEIKPHHLAFPQALALYEAIEARDFAAEPPAPALPDEPQGFVVCRCGRVAEGADAAEHPELAGIPDDAPATSPEPRSPATRPVARDIVLRTDGSGMSETVTIGQAATEILGYLGPYWNYERVVLRLIEQGRAIETRGVTFEPVMADGNSKVINDAIRKGVMP
jgi:hypothetical protein